jgi:hypothetical protein
MSRIPLVLAACLIACGSPAETPAPASAKTQPPAPVAAAAAPAGAPAAANGDAVTVRTHDGADVVTVTKRGDGAIEVSFTDGGQKTTLQGISKDGVKRKYSSGGNVLFEVKGDDGGFKLRNPAGGLLYKVKFSDDKIKVSDNEENTNAFELKTREGDRIKVMAPGDKEMGNVRSTTVENATGKKLFEVSGRPGSAGYGVLLLEGIPAAQRFIVLAELVSRGK